ncbi:hypothetical protein GWK47_013067 [Chionoecetes opilio]|uniref:Uncharacterized protein n=1 Tax=Chionoecetes opilio TaxID=41210 RepID=A0A8J5C1J6_CHIOP|nr:hypothetical protein GWK47_013067 [Chionoecetes opilio]
MGYDLSTSQQIATMDHHLYTTKVSPPGHTVLWRPQKDSGVALKPSDYRPFSHVVRTVHLQDSLDICVTGCITPKPITSLSSLKRSVLRQNHPCKRLHVLWFGVKYDDVDEDAHDWYGNVEFAIPIDSLMQRWTKYYLVEVMTAPTHSTTRILVTNSDYSSILPVYDPHTRGGGWHITPDGRHMQLGDCRRYNGDGYNKHGHIIEFMIEVTPFGMRKIVEETVMSFKNHEEAVTDTPHVCHRFKGPPNCPTPFTRACTSRWFFHEHGRLNTHQLLVRPKLSPSAEELLQYFLTMEGIPRNVLAAPPCLRPSLPPYLAPCPPPLSNQHFPPLPTPTFIISHHLVQRNENGRVLKLHQMLGRKQDDVFRLIAKSITKPKRHPDEEEEEVMMAMMMANRRPPPRYPHPPPHSFYLPPSFGPPPGLHIRPPPMDMPPLYLPPPPLLPYPPGTFQHSWAHLQPITFRKRN